MKITCNSCGSKYTIADAKVQGKKVKVRCKGCKESILVDGTKIGSEGETSGSHPATAAPSEDDSPQQEAPALDSNSTNDAPAATGNAAADVWSINLSDDDSRDMTLDELIAGWKDGTVTSDAYVWKDGMADWKPILEVGELKLKLGSAPKKAAAAGVVSSAGAGAAKKSDDKMDDLFGGVDEAGNEPAQPDKPAVAAGADKPTGARNDSSVLFSLDSLNQQADDAPANKGGAANLFAGLDAPSGPGLAGNTDLLTAPAKDPPPAPAGNRAAPVVAAPKKKGKAGLIAAVVGGLVVIGAGLFFVMGSGDEDADKAPAADAEMTAAEKEAAEKAKKELEEKMARLEKMEAELKKAKEGAEKKGEDPDEAAEKKKEELEKEKEEAEKKEAAAGKDSGSSSSSSGSSKTSGSSSSSSGSTAKKFDVGAARAALQAAAANAASCKKPGGPTGSGKVQLTFSTSGRVTSANVVSGPFGGTAVGGCVASTFRRARVPAFSGSPKTVAKSFRIP